MTADTTKADRMTERGYTGAKAPGTCGICTRKIYPGQWIGRMPDSWEPENRYRWAHRQCVEQLIEQVRAKAERLGLVVPPAGGEPHMGKRTSVYLSDDLAEAATASGATHAKEAGAR